MPSVRKPSVTSGRGPIRPMNRAWVHAPQVQASVAACSTGTSFVITDLRSANGVDVGGERIRGTATLADGDRIRICDHEFTFEIAPRQT